MNRFFGMGSTARTLGKLALLASLALAGSTLHAYGQQTENLLPRKMQVDPLGTPAPAQPQRPRKPPVASEIAQTTMVSYGDYRVFGATARCNVYTSGIEYDRNSWGHFLKARIDYVVEVLPWVILREPAAADFWGNPKSPDQQTLHGVGITPFGFRFLWRSNARVKPYMTGKAGGIVFNKKAMSPSSSYANFNFQGNFGVEVRMSRRWELRVEPLEYFHVSNGYLAASNPGMDELAAKFGMSYRLGERREE